MNNFLEPLFLWICKNMEGKWYEALNAININLYVHMVVKKKLVRGDRKPCMLALA